MNFEDLIKKKLVRIKTKDANLSKSLILTAEYKLNTIGEVVKKDNQNI